ncbi:MAG: acyltransferase family protein [Tardiphaga sp.]
MPQPAVPAAPERLHALDAVRGFALLLGVVLHATISFVPAPTRIWIIEDSHPSMLLTALFFVIHVFRMTTFFVMAGFFSHMAFHRRGAAGFVLDRLQRIALPLAMGWPIVFAAMVPVVRWAAGLPHGGPIPGAPRWPPELPAFPLAHLWFLYVLLELYAAMLLLRWCIVRFDRSGRIRATTDRSFAAIMRSPFAPLLLAIPIGVAFFLDPTWVVWMGVRTPEQSLITNIQAWIGFGTAFGFGWLLHRQSGLLGAIERRWALNLVPAIALIAVCFVLGLMRPPTQAAVHFAAAACYAVAIWTTTFALIGAALRFLSGYSATRRYLADASYWVYLVHIPIVLALQVAVAPLDWPWPVKFGAILLVAIPLMLVSYQLLVRTTFVGMVLNGRRIVRGKKRSVQPA